MYPRRKVQGSTHAKYIPTNADPAGIRRRLEMSESRMLVDFRRVTLKRACNTQNICIVICSSMLLIVYRSRTEAPPPADIAGSGWMNVGLRDIAQR